MTRRRGVMWLATGVPGLDGEEEVFNSTSEPEIPVSTGVPVPEVESQADYWAGLYKQSSQARMQLETENKYLKERLEATQELADMFAAEAGVKIQWFPEGEEGEASDEEPSAEH